MPLSISKLEELLASKGFVPSKYFVMDGLCFYIELIAIQSANKFLLYIPSKYKFNIDKGPNVFKIRYIDMDSSDNTTDEYAGSPDNVNVESAYGDARIDLSPARGEKLEDHLEESYRRPISLNDISTEDTHDLKATYRQMRRLRYCVQSIKYKVGIMFKNYICAIRRDDSIDCFSIKHHPRKDCKKMLVIIDLEMFYEKNEKILSDIETVRTGIHNILVKNQGTHTRMMSRMLESKEEIESISGKTQVKKAKYDSYIRKLERMLDVLNQAEKRYVAELYEVGERSGDATAQGMHSDIQNAHRKNQIETEIAKINKIKEKVMRNIMILRERRENTVLSIDKIMFDNTVMFDCMVKNFAKLKGFC